MTWQHLFHLWPESTNHIWSHGRRVFLATKAKMFRKAVEHEVMWARMQNDMPKIVLKTDLHVGLEFFPPNKRRRDIDNLLKSVFDAMTWAGVWMDDSQVKSICASFEQPKTKEDRGSFWITIEELSVVEERCECLGKSNLLR